jgi:hypothetical protein
MGSQSIKAVIYTFQWLHYDETDLLDFCILLD